MDHIHVPNNEQYTPHSAQPANPRSTLVLLSHYHIPKSLVHVFARGLAYQPSVATVIAVGYQLYYIALDTVGGVSDSLFDCQRTHHPLGHRSRPAHFPALVFHPLPHRYIHLPFPAHLGALLYHVPPHCGPTSLDRIHRGVDRAVYRAWSV